MTEEILRDKFAMAALTGLICQAMGNYRYSPDKDWAAIAYTYADAMMKAREATHSAKQGD